MKNYLVEFKCVIGDYEHTEHYIFNKKKSEWGYCKEFWGINKRDSNCLKGTICFGMIGCRTLFQFILKQK